MLALMCIELEFKNLCFDAALKPGISGPATNTFDAASEAKKFEFFGF